MKKYILIFVSLLNFSISIAQPANDNCSSAQDIGPLPTPAGCPSGIGAALTVSGTLIGATASNPYCYQTGCSGGTTMSHPANDVWYKFTATGYKLIITITSTFQNPNVAVFSGNCSSLGGGIGGCAVGTTGGTSLSIEQLTIGTTYYILVSGNGSETGTFTMSINNNVSCMDCLISSELIASPAPISGTYAPGQTVNFCYHISKYNQVNTNWLHGVQMSFGSGWNLSTLTTNPPPTCQTPPSGAWMYSPTPIFSAVNVSSWPAGFYFDADLDGNPGNNYGDNCNGTQDSATWNFCFSITTLADSNLTIVFSTSGDGESGSWSNSGCSSDPSFIFNASSNSGNIATYINNPTLSNRVTIYPNPFSSAATIKIVSASKISNAQLTISDIYGSIVKNMIIHGNEALIDRGTLVDGMYLYKVINDKELIGNGKFIIK